ncbi:MAG: hypothetical protein IKR74_02845 [Bacilli bacterium]|nr:hypothetical protein [Bacilli bacterium]
MFNDIVLFLRNLSFIDYIFFFTVVFLIILVVSLIYFIRINEDIIEKEEEVTDPDNLQSIASAIKNDAKPITFTSYEKEQEDKAIISYDELVSNTGNYTFNYTSEDDKDGVSIKKFDLDNLISESAKKEEPKIEVHLFSLKREEEFLKALKELQKSLN